MTIPKASVIIRTFNEEKYLPRLLESLKNQAYRDFEIIVVDSGSQDRTRDIASTHADKLLRIESRDFTFGYSLNVGIGSASGEYAVIVSAHTLPTNGQWLGALLAPLSDENIAMSYGSQVGWETSKFSESQDLLRTFGSKSKIQEPPDYFAHNANSAVRIRLWKEHPFDEALPGLEDLEWAKHWMERGHRVAYEPTSSMHHIHEEDWRQVRRRYYREALAARWIGEKSRRHVFFDSAKEVLYGLSDLRRAIGTTSDPKQRNWLARWVEIVFFRMNKGVGNFRGLLNGATMPDSDAKEAMFFDRKSPQVLESNPRTSPMETKGRVVLLEFRDEGEAYLAQCATEGKDHSDDQIIALDPSLRAWLNKQGVSAIGTTGIFDSASHARSQTKSHELLDWLDTNFQYKDNLEISDAYTNALKWYSRYYLHHLLWVSEIVDKACSTNGSPTVMAALGGPEFAQSGSPRLGQDERYLGLVAKIRCRELGLAFQEINLNFKTRLNPASTTKSKVIRRLRNRLGGPLHRAALRRLGKHRPALALTHGYSLDTLVAETRKLTPELPWTVIGEAGGSSKGSALFSRAYQAVTAGLGKLNESVYAGEVWPQILQSNGVALKDIELKTILNDLAFNIESEGELFSHQGVGFAGYYADKIRNGIGPSLLQLGREIQAIDETLELLNPSLVVTPFGRRAHLALGELASRRNIPGLLIAHGTFTPMKTKLEEMSWAFHSYGLLHGSYSHAALQTPQAEEFTKQIYSPVNFVRTGPLAWGRQVDRELSQRLRKNILADNENCMVVMHAGTPKGRGSRHLHVYESPDEYVSALNDLVTAIDQLSDVYLIIKFRPNVMGVEDLLSLLPKSSKFYISVEEPFHDVLGMSDLLVSFSSTTIEEAFQNRVPVLLYGGNGRYQHVEAMEVNPDMVMDSRAAYSISGSAHLPEGIRRILDANGKAPLPEELFASYVYKTEDVTSFPQLARELARRGLNKN